MVSFMLKEASTTKRIVVGFCFLIALALIIIDAVPASSMVEAVPVESVVDAVPVERVVDAVPVESVVEEVPLSSTG